MSLLLNCKNTEQIFKAITAFFGIRSDNSYKMEVLVSNVKYLELMTSEMEVLEVRNNNFKAEAER